MGPGFIVTGEDGTMPSSKEMNRQARLWIVAERPVRLPNALGPTTRSYGAALTEAVDIMPAK